MKKDTVVPKPAHGDSQIITVSRDATVAAAAKIMRDKKIGCLVVTGAGGRLAGILSERDIVGRVFGDAVDPLKTLVQDIMITDVVSCVVNTPISKVQELMTERRIRHLPIVEDGVPVGMISSREVMAHQHAKDVAMRAAAEEVARLSTSLKSLDLEEVVDMITREVPKVFRAQRNVLCFPQEDDSGERVLQINRCKCPCPERDLRTREDAKEACRNSEALLEYVPAVCEKLGGRSPNVVIPLAVEDPLPADSSTPGYLCMCDIDQDNEVSEELVRYKIALLQDILSTNLVNAKLYEEYQKARRTALTDALTGVGTRKFFEERLEAEHARAGRYKRPFCVAIWDVDKFKEINDTLGHAGGDKALLAFSKCISQQKRASDVLARYGGDEFILLLPETSLDDAGVLLERIRLHVQRILIAPGRSLTTSCGVVEQDIFVNASANELIRRADLALYHAKRSGRNQIARWDQIPQGLQYGSYVETKEIKALQRRVAGLLGESKQMFLASLRELVQGLDAKDPYTKSHSENVMRYAVGIAETLGMSAEEVEVIRNAAMVHDVGNLGLPANILSKPGDMSGEERRIMEQHPLIAVRILDEMRFLEREIPLVRHHHERWDGEGYPDGISGAAIEPGARVLTAADAFDAITSPRSYRKPRTVTAGLRVLTDCAGTQFGPENVGAMVLWVSQVGQYLGKDEVTKDDLLAAQASCALVA